MKKTRKQYLPQVKHKKYDAGKWKNVMGYDVNGGKRYADTLEEAQQAIERARKLWEDASKKGQRHVVGSIGISVEPPRDDRFYIVESRIRVREVTEWEDVD